MDIVRKRQKDLKELLIIIMNISIGLKNITEYRMRSIQTDNCIITNLNVIIKKIEKTK